MQTSRVKVTKVERLDEVKTVYDLCIDQDHSYVANGLMSHNTATGLQLGINMARWGAKVCFISLEMEPEEMAIRLAANLSKVNLTKIIDPTSRLSKAERESILQKEQDFHNDLRRRAAMLTFYHPEEDISMEELMFTLKPYGFDVIILDYINLLRDMDGDMQWQKLSAGARFCKRFASKNKAIVVLLTQLSEEGVIRYSKGIQEHACLVGDTLVDTSNGVMRIREVVGDEEGSSVVPVGKINIHGTALTSPVTAVHNNGERECLQITLLNGVRIGCTLDHRWLVSTDRPGGGSGDYEWIEARNLKTGDLIPQAVSRDWRHAVKIKPPEDLVRQMIQYPMAIRAMLSRADPTSIRSFWTIIVKTGQVHGTGDGNRTMPMNRDLAEMLHHQLCRIGRLSSLHPEGENLASVWCENRTLIRSKYSRYLIQRDVEIASIVNIGMQRVYDVTVPGTNAFLANNLISHNSNFWSWVYNDDARNSHILPVKQIKARNQKAFDFHLLEDFGTMTISDHDGEEIVRPSGGGRRNQDGADRKGKKDDYLQM